MQLGQVDNCIFPHRKENKCMPCYHPRLRIENLTKWETAADGHKYHPATIIQPDDVYEKLEKLNQHINYKKTIIPCRQCIGCRLEYSRQWANRGYLEAKKSEHNYFVTLTYDDEHLKILDEITTSDGITYANDGTWNGVLIPEHFTKFIHDLRQIMKRDYNHEGFKFMGCGEYGEKNQRSHYHCILFNCPLPTETFYAPRIIEKNFYWQNRIIERAWKYGISNITTATWNTIAYVSRYITKKIYGKESEHEYAKKGQIKEFIRMSRGIGKDYYENNREKIQKYDTITIKNQNGVIQTKPPKYFDNLMKKEQPETLEKIKTKREKMKNTNDKIKDTTYSTGRLQQLEIEERTHEERTLKLKRIMEK